MASEQIVDQLRYGLGVVTDRCQRVRKDVADWEAALKNVVDAQDEMDEAAACYAIPRYVDAVVRGEVTDPQTLVKALVHLTGSRDYLDSKPTNQVGSRLRVKVTNYLDRATEKTQQAVHNAVIGSIRSAIGPPVQARLAVHCDTRAVITGNSGALRMFRDDWRRRLADIFSAVEQLAIVFDDLKAAEAIAESCAARVKTYLKELVTEDYVNKHEGVSLTGAVNAAGSPAAALFVAAAGRRQSMRVGAALSSVWKRVTGGGGDDVSDLAAGGGGGGDDASSASTYRQGDHPLIQFSRDVRQLAAESEMIYEYAVLKAFPTTDDDPRYHRQLALPNGPSIREAAYGIPSTLLVAVVAEAVFDRVSSALAHVARSPEVGIFDGIFIALDLLAECWQWRKVARACPGRRLGAAGQCAMFDDVNQRIDEMVDDVMATASTLLDDYRDSKGQLDEEELVRSTASSDYFAVKGQSFSDAFLLLLGLHSRELSADAANDDAGEDDGDDDAAKTAADQDMAIPRAVRCRWLPSYDCTVHPSTTGMLRFFKHVVTGFEAIFCIAAAGSCADADALLAKNRPSTSAKGRGGRQAPGASSREWATTVAEYMEKCMLAHLEDLSTIARAASVTLNPPTEDDPELGEAPYVLFNRAVFLANNMHFAVRSLTEDAEFTSTARARDMCKTIVDEYKEKLDDAAEYYGGMWSAVLPPVPDTDEHLRGATNSEANELTKPQRKRVKEWYMCARGNLEKMVGVSKAHVVAQVAMRQRLSATAALAVEKRYVEFEETVVKGRTWTHNPAKYFLTPAADDAARATVATTVTVVRNTFPAPYAPLPFRAPGPAVEL